MYINGIAGISAQNEELFLSGKALEYNQNIFPALSPDYKKHIPAMALRRMSKAVKMGFTTAKMALEDAGSSDPEAIITGTGQGCKQDTEKFLEAMFAQNEELLSPTSFIQSTHNTVGGQIALSLNCKSYNVTYTQNSGSLESALIDAQLQFMEHPHFRSVLVGGVDEVSETITSFLYLDQQLKQEEIKNLDLLKSTTPGTITSEGAHFFSISAERTEHTYARLVDTSLFGAESSADVRGKILNFLSDNDLTEEDIDTVILGNNGDKRFDWFYRELQIGLLKNTQQLAYKHLVGDYNTVSGYAIWLGCKIFKEQVIPEALKLNFTEVKSPKRILLYNQYLGKDHSLILLEIP